MTLQIFYNFFIIFLKISLIIIIYVNPVYADIYKYIDKDGVTHFTDSPKKAEFILYFKHHEEKNEIKISTDLYDSIILKAARINGISFSIIKALIKVESDFNPNAVSSAGAKGLMQIMPINIKDLKIKDPFNPYENIMGGSEYFRRLLERFNGQLTLALAAYNAGPTIVVKYNSIPPYRETKKFVAKVLKYNYKYKY